MIRLTTKSSSGGEVERDRSHTTGSGSRLHIDVKKVYKDVML